MKLPTIALAGVLSLAACQTPGTTNGGASIIEQTQAIATQVCGFLPLAETIAAILGQGRPELQTASQIANAVCGAVTRRSGARASARPTVAGVPVNGQFVR